MTTATVDCAASALEAIRAHVAPELEREVGGILVGRLGAGGAEVRAALPAVEAHGGRTHVTFTHDVWEQLLTEVDRDHPDDRIVGWYHSHPGFGIFLSGYDRFIHRSFFSGPDQLAFVIDPHTGAEGWFGWQGDDIALLSETGPTRAAATPAARAAAPRQRRNRAFRVVAVALLVAGSAFAYRNLTAPAPQPPPVPQASSPATAPPTARSEGSSGLRELRGGPVVERPSAGGQPPAPLQPEPPLAPSAPPVAPVGAAPTPPVAGLIEVHVRPGQSLSHLAVLFYGDAAKVARIAAANPGIDADALAIGQLLRIPVDLLLPGSVAP
ncbi:hypothetical protein BH23ACT8_BH23ACT8_24910 [soil metagenome]